VGAPVDVVVAVGIATGFCTVPARCSFLGGSSVPRPAVLLALAAYSGELMERFAGSCEAFAGDEGLGVAIRDVEGVLALDEDG